MTETAVERRRRLVRHDIARIAIDLFVERGYENVTADEIAQSAGISQRTLFRYFASKDEIVLDLADRLEQRLVAALDARPTSEGAFTALREAYCETSHVAPEERHRVQQVAKILADVPHLRAHAHGGHLRDDDARHARLARRLSVRSTDLRVRVLLAAVSSVATSEFYRWAARGGRGDPSVAIGAALDLLAVGLDDLDAPRPTRTR